MPQPYSPDLRERVLVACERGDRPRLRLPAASRSAPPPCRTGAARSARRAELSQAAQRRRTLAPGCSALEVLRQLVIEDNDALLREYRERLADERA